MTAKYTKISFRLLLLLILLSSCTSSYRTIMIETAKPSSDQLPESIKSLTLMNRSISPEFKNYDEDSLQLYFYNQNFDEEAVILDSVAADTTLRALAQLLFESGRYDVVIPLERNFKRDLPFNRMPEELDWDEVTQICEEFNTDALLVIERYYNKLTTDYFAVQGGWGFLAYATATIDSKYDAVIRIYDPVKREIAKQLVISDTIYWYETDASTEEIFRRLPSIKQCLIQTGIQVALETDSRLSPQWTPENRSYYVLDKNDAQEISGYIDNDNWESAYNYWLQFSTSEKKSIKSKAEYNLALASEMLGNIDQAIEWANRSYYTEYRSQTVQYLYRLKERKEILGEFQEFTNP